MIIEPIEFKDEILDVTSQPDNKPRYRIRDNNGNVLYENVQLEVQTPVVQEGTKISADMFNELNNQISNFANDVERELKLQKKSGLEIYFGW